MFVKQMVGRGLRVSSDERKMCMVLGFKDLNTSGFQQTIDPFVRENSDPSFLDQTNFLSFWEAGYLGEMRFNIPMAPMKEKSEKDLKRWSSESGDHGSLKRQKR